MQRFLLWNMFATRSPLFNAVLQILTSNAFQKLHNQSNLNFMQVFESNPKVWLAAISIPSGLTISGFVKNVPVPAQTARSKLAPKVNNRRFLVQHWSQNGIRTQILIPYIRSQKQIGTVRCCTVDTSRRPRLLLIPKHWTECVWSVVFFVLQRQCHCIVSF